MKRDILENVRLDFDEGNMLLLNFSIALIMFGVSLGLRRSNFIDILKSPRAAITGVISQFVLLPFITFILVWITDPLPGLALGMILVASCPGGNLSNFFTFLSKGNVALSISLTAVASVLAVVATPLNLELWGGLLPSTNGLLKSVDIDFWQMVQTIFYIIGIPLFLGIFVHEKWPRLAFKVQKPLKYISVLILVGIIVMAFMKNYALFMEYYQYIVVLVLMHNGLALLGGYTFSRLMKNTRKDVRSITIETGIQNSALGLVMIFTFFNGNGGMALIAAWWGIWHIISGFVISQYFSRRMAVARA